MAPPRLRAFGEDFTPTRRVPALLRGRKNNNNINKNQQNKESQAHVIRGLSLGMGSAALPGLPHSSLPKLALDCKRAGFLKSGARVLFARDITRAGMEPVLFCLLTRNSAYYYRIKKPPATAVVVILGGGQGGTRTGEKKKSSRSSNFFLFEVTGPEENKSLKPPKLPPK